MISKVAERWLRKLLALSSEERPLYTAIFLSPMDRARLFRRFGQTHPVQIAHHMTIWYFEEGGDPNLAGLPLGQTVPLKVIGYANDDRAQAVIVQPPAKLQLKAGRVPHITLSTENGVTPVYSNKLIKKTWDVEEAQSGLPTVRGKVGWWDGIRERYDLV